MTGFAHSGLLRPPLRARLAGASCEVSAGALQSW